MSKIVEAWQHLRCVNSGNYKTALPEISRLQNKASAGLKTLLHVYFYGQGVPKNYKTALKWFRLAADQGSANALPLIDLQVWERCSKGSGNCAQVVQAGCRRQCRCQNERVDALLGQSTTNDPKTAVEWFRLAAENGLPRTI